MRAQNLEVFTADGRDTAALQEAFAVGRNGYASIGILDLLHALENGDYTTNDRLFMRLPSYADIPPVYEFADSRGRVDNQAHLLLVDGEERQLAPIGFRLLQCLAANIDTVVDKPKLVSVGWADRSTNFAISNNLTLQISAVRKAFGPELGNRETGALRVAQGLGYRLLSQLAR